MCGWVGGVRAGEGGDGGAEEGRTTYLFMEW